MSATKISFGIQFICSHSTKIPLSFDSFIYHKRIFSMHSQTRTNVLASSMHAIERLTAYLWACCLLRKILEYFESHGIDFVYQKIREKEIQTIQAFVLEPLRNVGLLLQNAQRSPHVFRMFIKFSWFVVISSKLWHELSSLLSAYWFMLTNTEAISCGLFMLLIASSIFGYGSILEHLEDTWV